MGVRLFPQWPAHRFWLADGVIKVWDIESLTEITTLTGHGRGLEACGYSPDGRLIVSASYDDTLKLWDAESFEEIAILAGHSDGVRAWAYSPDGQALCPALSTGSSGCGMSTTPWSITKSSATRKKSWLVRFHLTVVG